MAESYYFRVEETIKKFNQVWANKRFVDLKAYEVQNFFTSLNEYNYKTVKAKIKESAKEKLGKAALEFGIRKVCEESKFSRPTLYYARNGEVIDWVSAKLICEKFNLNVNECFDKIITEKPYKKETKMKYKRVLSCIFNYAISIELISINYASSAYLKNIIGREELKEIDILSESQIDNLLNVLDRHELSKTIPIYLMTMLGIRSCEVCGLEWKDIDFKNRVISINRNRIYIPHKGIIRKELKTKTSKRDIYIVDTLLEKLKEYKSYYEMLKENDDEFSECDAIYCNHDGTPAFPHNINSLLKRFLNEVGCKIVSPHKLRHSWITRLISKGIPINVVSKMAGHADCEITLKVYTHYSKDVDNSKDVLSKIFDKK